MGKLIAYALILIVSILLAIILLGSTEWIHFAYWKRKKCPACGKRYGFDNLNQWRDEYIFHCVELEEHPEDAYSRGVICPHCGHYHRTGSAAHI